MMKSIFVRLWLLLLGVGFGSCAGGVVDQAQLNHPAMSFESPLLPSTKNYLSNIKSLDGSTGGGACTTCAY